jgi:hypothetical protein
MAFQLHTNAGNRPRKQACGLHLETLEPRCLLTAMPGRAADLRFLEGLTVPSRPAVVSAQATKSGTVHALLSIAQLNARLPGKWHVDYDASSLFGPGARGVQEIVFNGPRGPKTFISTTGVVTQGFFGPAYYQFSSWGTYRFLNNRLLRLTITGGSPTEYLNRGIIIMGGQSMPLQFLNKNQFVSGGQTFRRIPLNSGVF